MVLSLWRCISAFGWNWGKDTPNEDASANVHATAAIPTQDSQSFMDPFQVGMDTPLPRTVPRIRRRSMERNSGRWDRSTVGALEVMCDSLFETSKRLSLRLDFEPETRTTPVYPMFPVPASPESSRTNTPSITTYQTQSESPTSPTSRSRDSKASSGKRILRNIPTVPGGFWNMCMRSVPKIKFVKKFEESDV